MGLPVLGAVAITLAMMQYSQWSQHRPSYSLAPIAKVMSVCEVLFRVYVWPPLKVSSLQIYHPLYFVSPLL